MNSIQVQEVPPKYSPANRKLYVSFNEAPSNSSERYALSSRRFHNFFSEYNFLIFISTIFSFLKRIYNFILMKKRDFLMCGLAAAHNVDGKNCHSVGMTFAYLRTYTRPSFVIRFHLTIRAIMIQALVIGIGPSF